MTKKKGRKGLPIGDDVGKLSNALAAFGLHYGQDDTKLDKWQALCSDCGIEHGPSIKKCKRVGFAFARNICAGE